MDIPSGRIQKPKDLDTYAKAWLDSYANKELLLSETVDGTRFFRVKVRNHIMGKGGQAFVVSAYSPKIVSEIVARVELDPEGTMDAADHATVFRRLKLATSAHARNLRHLLGCLGARHGTDGAELYKRCVPLDNIQRDFPGLWSKIQNPEFPERLSYIYSFLKSCMVSQHELQELAGIFAEGSPFAGQQVFLQFCDQKVSNLFLDIESSTLRTGDYGSLGLAPKGSERNLPMVSGSIEIMPPEFAKGLLHDKIDVYSSAKACLQVFSRAGVFMAKAADLQRPETISRLLQVPVDEPIVGLLSRCLSVDHTERLSTESALLSLANVDTDCFARFLVTTINSNPHEQPIQFGSARTVQANGITESTWLAQKLDPVEPEWVKVSNNPSNEHKLSHARGKLVADAQIKERVQASATAVFNLPVKERAAALVKFYRESNLAKLDDTEPGKPTKATLSRVLLRDAEIFIAEIIREVVKMSISSDEKLQALIQYGLKLCPDSVKKVQGGSAFNAESIKSLFKSDREVNQSLSVWARSFVSNFRAVQDARDEEDAKHRATFTTWADLCSKIGVSNVVPVKSSIFVAIAAGLLTFRKAEKGDD